MNVKFKMPKFNRPMSYGGMVKEIMMTIIGTTISIVLTFGTSHYLEQVQADESRRLVAMTIINDIDESLKVVKAYKEAEEKGHDLTFYLMNHVDSLEKISDDTLLAFFDYISRTSFHVELEFKKANENIFNSNQDSWRKLNDRIFLNNVQAIYNARAALERQLKEWVYFQKPLTKDEEYQLIMNSDALQSREHFLPACRDLLKSKRVKNYVDNFRMRVNCYRDVVEYLNLNEENKLLMDITEQDLKDFANKTYMKVRTARDHELVGDWKAVTADDREQINIEFRRDHTFTSRRTAPWGHDIYTGFMIQKFTTTGTWHTENDSLVINYDMKSCQIEIDDEGITYMPRMAGMVEQFKKDLLEGKYKPPFAKNLEKDSRQVYATNIDKQGTRMELTEKDKKPMHYQRQM